MDKTSSGELTSRIGFSRAKIAPAQGGAPRLVVLMGSEPGRRYGLEGDVVVLGRSEECDVQLDDSKVSRRHARVQRVEEDWVIEDLGSRNGTVVNGEQVGSRVLEVGDRIQLSGETLLLFTRQDPLEDLLLHRQQMAVIGQLAAGIAHDFNNLLNVISASTSHVLALDGQAPVSSPQVRECHEDIMAAATRAAELTRRLLTLARRRRADVAETGDAVDVSALCRDALQLVRRTFDQSVRIESQIEPELIVDGDHAALHQVLMNLCINARDAMPEGGTLRVAAFHELEPGAEANQLWTPGPQVVVEVSDTGTGMDEKTRARVFEPFFTTKESGAGSGLGLATAYEVATTHGGTVEVESEPGDGSTFRVRLPARMRRVNKRASRKRHASTWNDRGGPAPGGRVLVVDDEELVRRSLGRLLKAAGYEVRYASDGEAALEAYAAARPDLVLLDLDMPQLSGAETLTRLRARDPGARVLLISGYYDEARKKRLLALGAVDFLGKPVEARELRDTIRLALAVREVDLPG